MPDKLTTYVQLAEDTTRAIMHSHETWTAFLSTAARMYKYAYNDQLMIHAQRPAATACAPYEVWNQKMSRYVRRGSKGIALLDSSGDTVALHYVFDVADTGTTRRSPPMNLWQMERHHTLPIMDALQSTYDTAPPAVWSVRWSRLLCVCLIFTGRNTALTFSVSLTVPLWRAMMNLR